MAYPIRQPSWRAVLALAAEQHGVVTRAQLSELGIPAHGVTHRISRGRLHPVFRGVYAVGRPDLDRDGRWKAALLACGRGAVLSHSSAGAFWGICREGPQIEVSISPPRTVSRPGIKAHRRSNTLVGQLRVARGIAVTDPARTLIDLAPRTSADDLESLLGIADRLDLHRSRPASHKARRPLERPRRRPPPKGPRPSHVDPHRLPARASAAADCPPGWTRPPVDAGVGQRLPGRLLLAGPRSRSRDRRSALSPDRRPTDRGRPPGPGSHGRRPHATALLPRSGRTRSCGRRGNAPPHRRPPSQFTRLTDCVVPGPANAAIAGFSRGGARAASTSAAAAAGPRAGGRRRRR